MKANGLVYGLWRLASKINPLRYILFIDKSSSNPFIRHELYAVLAAD